MTLEVDRVQFGCVVSLQPFFSVLIVNYNGGEYLQGAVNSLAAQTFTDFETIIIDNDSKDGSLERLDASVLSDCRIEALGRNSGFAEGNNIGAKLSRGRWLALLNADAVASPDWLQKLREAIEAYPDCAMFASTQISMDDDQILDGAGDGYTAYGFAWRGCYHRSVNIQPGFGETFSPCGASAAYRRETFLEFGGFDERFFCFMEDVDLAFRMRLAGEYCLYLPDAVVTHKGGGLSGEQSEFSVVHGARNRVWAYWANMPSWLLFVTLPGHLVLTAYLLIWYFGRPYSSHVWKGTVMGWKEAREFRRDRDKLRKSRKVSLFQLARSFFWNPIPMSRHASSVMTTKRTKQ